MSKLHRAKASDSTRTLCGRAVSPGVALAPAGQPPTCRVCLRAGTDAPAVAPTPPPGIVLAPNAWVLFGSELNCTRPGTVDMDRVRNLTPEGRTILVEDVQEGSARWQILQQALFRRLREATAPAAQARGTDCVIRSGDIRDARGHPVVDITDTVIVHLH